MMRLPAFPIYGVVFLVFGLLFIPSVAQAQATRTVSETRPLDRDGTVQLDSFTGDITVTTWDRDAVQIGVRIEGDDVDAVDQTRIRIEGDEDELRIETDYDALENRFLGLFSMGSKDRPPTFYTITMPATAALSVNDFSSTIAISGLRNGLTLDTFSSPVRLEDIEGFIQAETYSSEFEARDVAGRIHLETFSGDATIAMRAVTGDCQFEGFSGDVEVLLPADAGLDLDAEMGMSGNFDSDFVLDAVRDAGNEYRGPINGGGPRLRFETFSGNLTLRSL